MAKRMSAREKMHKSLKNQTEKSHKTRDAGGSFKNYFDDSKMDGVATWFATKGDHIIDVIPYFAGDNDPRNANGDPCYVLDIEVHRNVGPMEEMVVCLEQYGKPCPICEKRRELSHADADYKTEIKPLKPGRRVMYNIIVRDGGDMEKKGNQIFEIAHWFMEKHLAKIAKDPRGGGFTVFSDPDDGKSVSFERSGVGATSTNYEGHRFVDRPEPITDEELDAALCLDDLITILEYDAIFEMFHGKSVPKDEESSDHVETDEPDETEAPARGKKKKRDKKKKSKTLKCPHGGTIGDSIDELDECDDCDIYDECEEIADEL